MGDSISQSVLKSFASWRASRRHDRPDGCPDDYEFVRRVGVGAFSEVFLVCDRQDRRLYALKRLRPEWRDDPNGRLLLVNEAEAASQARSRHLVPVVRAELDVERPYLILEWISGTSLEQQLQDEPRLCLGRALWIARQCLQGLADLVGSGFAHGDIKPANIFLTRSGEVKLVDLGFARPVEGLPRIPKNCLTGTIEYMAPEVFIGDESAPIARDLYSMGVTLFRMLTGRFPYEASSAAGLQRLQQLPPPCVSRWRAEAPPRITELVEQLLAPAPAERPTDLERLVREFMAVELSVLPARFASSREWTALHPVEVRLVADAAT